VEVMNPEPLGLNGTLTNRFGGNAFFIKPVSLSLDVLLRK